MRTRTRLGLSAFLAALLSPAALCAFELAFAATDLDDALGPGGDLWQYAYSASGFSFEADQGFSVEFDADLYERLGDPPFAVNPDWDAAVIQPDPALALPGVFDVLARVDGASLADPFVVRFVWLGGAFDSPGVQPWTLNQYDEQGELVEVLASGATLPEPASGALAACAVVSLAACARRGARARATLRVRAARRRCAEEAAWRGRAARAQPCRPGDVTSAPRGLRFGAMSTSRWETIGPPPLALFALEQGRAVLELAAVRSRRRARESAPKGDGHPVLVLPGLLAGDLSTAPLRRFLRALGYDVHGWGLGVNLGPNAALREGLAARFASLRERHGRRVSLVGWSLGGIYARELARARPQDVRLVITLASPFRDVSASHAARLVPLRRSGGSSPQEAGDLRASLRRPIPAPTTSVWSRSDGIVAWQGCVEDEGPQRENVEVACSHTGMGFHADVLSVIADRLAQPEGTWRPYRLRRGGRLESRPASGARSEPQASGDHQAGSEPQANEVSS